MGSDQGIEAILSDTRNEGSSNTSKKSCCGGKHNSHGIQDNKIELQLLKTLLEYMSNGLIGPFRVIKNTPSLLQKVSGSKGTVYVITGPDFVNRLGVDFNEESIARDISYALNKVFGFENLIHWYEETRETD